jgi:ERCC4-type nuclease
MRELSPVIVAQDQDHIDKKRRYSLVTELKKFNVPSNTSTSIAVDLFWTVDGDVCMFDIKKTKDFIDSYTDGRIYKQITAMKEANAKYWGFLIEDEDDTNPNFVGGKHGWSWDAFDDAVYDVQVFGGANIVRSPGEKYTPRRVAALWRWTGKDRASGWAAPVPEEATSDFKRGIIFFDESYRSQVGTLMHLPGCGLITANDLREQYSFMELLGITEEGLERAQELWAAVRGVGKKKVEAWLRFIRA